MKLATWQWFAIAFVIGVLIGWAVAKLVPVKSSLPVSASVGTETETTVSTETNTATV